MMTGEVRLLSLPPQLSDAVDRAVRLFERDHDSGIQSRNRWHDADIWILSCDRVLKNQQPGWVTHRVTIAAYSNRPDELRFISDIVVSCPSGRFMLPANEGTGILVRTLSIFDLLEEYRRDRDTAAPALYGGLRKIVRCLQHEIKQAWSAAIDLQPEFATQLIP